MKLRRGITYLALAVALLVVARLALFKRDPEPVYQGKRLSEWVVDYGRSDLGKEALTNIGTNALPWMVRWIQYESPAIVVRFRWELSRVEWRSLREWLLRGEYVAMGAERAFSNLGPEAAPAVPELVRVARGRQSAIVRRRAVSALGRIGGPALPALTEMLNCGDRTLAYGAQDAVLRMHENGVDVWMAIPGLLLRDKDTLAYVKEHQAADLIYARSLLGEKPVWFAAVLADCLAHTNAVVRAEAAETLGWLGMHGRVGVEGLRRLLCDSNAEVRKNATNALRAIEQTVGERPRGD